MKPADVRFYFDADILGLGKLVAGLRPDATYPGDPGAVIHRRQRPACSVTKARTPDSEWIPMVAAEGLLIVTRDRHIQQHRAEIGAVREAGARMVALAAEEAGTTWRQIEVLMCQWRRIEELADLEGPLIYTATRTSLTKVR